jgi:translation initiation factor 4G
MPQQPQQPINAAHYEKRPRKGLQIIDPNSGRDLSDEIYNNRQQKAPQVESTPPPSTAQTTDAPPAQAAPAVSQPSQEIQAQFAAQVAAAARGQFNSGSEKSSSASSSAGPVSKEGTPTPQIQPQQPQAATHVMHANTPTFVPQQSQPAVAVVTAHPQKQDVPPVIPPQQQVAAAPAASQQQQKPSKPQPMQQQQSKPVTPVEERHVTPERDAAPVQSAPPAATAAPKAPEPQQPEAPVPSTKKQASPPAAAIQTQAPLPQREVDTESQGRKKKGKHKARELNNKDKEGSDMDAFVVAPADNSSTSVGSPTSSVANTSTASSSSSQTETSPSVEEAKPVSAASPVVEDKAPEKEPSPAPQKKEPSPPQQTKEPSPEIKVQPPTPEVRKESKPAPTQAKPVPAKQQETVAPPTSTPSKQPESAKPVAAEAPSKRDSSPPVSKEEQKQNDKNDVVKDQDLEEGEIIDDDDDDESVNDKENKMNGDASGSEEEQLSKKRSNKKARSIELKYNYREDQWSPLNPEGKKLYDRHFLLDLQYSTESVEKPTGLPNLPDIILNEPIRKSESNPSNLSHMRGGVDFTPGYIKSINKPPASGKRGSQSGKHSRGGDPRNHNVKVISIERPLGGDVKLHSVGDNAWKPNSKKDKSGLTEEELKTRELYKKVTGILNKLTPQKFRKLVDQMIADCVIDTEDRLVGVIDIVFEKALDEPSFSVAYANLCKALSQLKVPRKDNPEQFTLFRNILLNRCQKEFEKDKTNEVDKTRMQEEVDACTTEEERAEMKLLMEEKIKKARRKSLGNIRFIGELFKLKMLTEKIMHDCILRLLKCDDQIDELECLCRLISTIGKDLDTSKNKQRMDAYFTQLQKIFDCSEKSLPSRIRFMIKDVIELRGSNWVPRRNESGPKMIDQIHKEAHDEELQRADLINRLKAEPMPTPNRNNRHGGRGSGHGQTAPVGDSDGWQTMGGKANKIDPTRMKLSRPMVSDDSIQLGPGGRPGSFGAWGRGSSGGSGKNSSQEADRPGPANRFNVLQGDGFQEQRGSTGRGLGRGLPPSRGDSREKSRMSGSRGGNMPPRLSGARSSMEQERESALSAARNISHGGPRGGSGSRNASRENSRGRDNSRDQARRAMPPPPPPAEAPAAAASTAAPTLGYDECKRKAESIMEEYLHLHDVKEAIACIKEVDSSNYADLIYHSIAFCIEKTKQARRMTGELIHDVLSRKVVTIQQFDKGVKQLMEIAEEMLLDVPMIFTYLGELFSPLIQDGSVPLTFLKDVCDPLPRRRAAQLVAEVLTEAASRLGDDVVAQQWHAAGLSWKDFLPEGEDLNAFMEKHKNLDFTLVGKEPKSPTQPKMDMAEFQDQLYKMLTRSGLTEDKDVAPVLNFINLSLTPAQRKTPAFIRALTTAVCWSAITGSGTSAAVEEANLKPRYNLLKKFLDHNNASELQALYALQALVHRLEHPPGVLRTFFDTFYDEDVVSEDAFNEWDESTDPAEMTGKGVARHSVAQFYTWLREAEDPEEQS